MRAPNKRLETIGLQLGQGKTFQEIADYLGISRQRVYQLWNNRKRYYDRKRKCIVCGEPFTVTHGNQRAHRDCIAKRRAFMDKLSKRRRNEIHAVTLPGNAGQLSIGLIQERLQRGWQWSDAVTLPRGQHRSKRR